MRHAALVHAGKGKRVVARLAHGVVAGNKTISRNVGFNRQDLAKATLQRFSQISKSLRVVATGPSKKQRRQGK